MGKIIQVSKYASLPQLLMNKHRKMPSIREWVHMEIKPGGYLDRYYEFKKRQTAAALRAVAIRTRTFKQNNDVDARVIAHVPLTTYMMMRRMDPYFWQDNKNIKSLKRDEPDFKSYV